MTRKAKPARPSLLARQLAAIGACSEAVTWARKYRLPLAAWRACKRGDWMLWAVGKLAGPPGSDSRRPLVLAACECARLALPSPS